jgi:hypothetical protein
MPLTPSFLFMRLWGTHMTSHHEITWIVKAGPFRGGITGQRPTVAATGFNIYAAMKVTVRVLTY